MVGALVVRHLPILSGFMQDAVVEKAVQLPRQHVATNWPYIQKFDWWAFWYVHALERRVHLQLARYLFARKVLHIDDRLTLGIFPESENTRILRLRYERSFFGTVV